MSSWSRARRAAIVLAQHVRPFDSRSVYFNSFQGRYSDNPRAIAECLAGRDGLTQVWRTNPAAADAFPPSVRTVPGRTSVHARAFGRAPHVITNDWMVSHPKRRGQTWVQTWHGTPLKRLALHRGLSRESARSVRRDSRKWDLLLSPNPFSTEIFRGAFGYEGRVLETGYPRNDVLSSQEADAIRRRVRDRLGIEARTTALLYAPPWRDEIVGADNPTAPVLTLNHRRMTEELGETHMLLLRLHRFIAPGFADVGGPSCLNVSGLPDIGELYLAADALVTDYSSAMFDVAVTRKPILLLTPDLDSYRDDLRGFYFDFEAEAPGPILQTTEELIDRLRSLAETRREFDARYEAFRERFCSLEDGHAAERVVEAVFGR